MLIKCPECNLQVSDKAYSCPHCGYPMQEQQEAANIRKVPQRSNKRKRLPNGFGQITKLRDSRLRKPFRAMVTVGINSETGRPICKLLKPVSYFETYNAAYEALIEYNKKRTKGVVDKTFKEVFDEWYEEMKDSKHSKSYMKILDASIKYCEPLYDLSIADLKAKDIRECIVDANTSSSFKLRIKSTLVTMFDYAMSLEYVDRNPAKMFKLPRNISTEADESLNSHLSFTDKEMDLLWKSSKYNPYVKMILIQCYSGWRPGELTDLRISNVDIENWTFTGGMKTKAGKNRTIPIHTKIQEFVKFFYDRAVELGSSFLFTTFDKDTHCGYSQYYKMFDRVKVELGLNPDHRPHDPRKFFVTEAKSKGVDDYAVKRIVGHAIEDLTENVYTERGIEWLRSEIEKI